MEIRSASAVAAVPRLSRVPETELALPATAQTRPGSASSPISKTRSAETSQDAPAAPHETRYVRDGETNHLVLSVVDPGTGDVIAQLPTKAALRAMAYASEISARAAVKPSIARLA